MKGHVSASKSALLLSSCVRWADPNSKHYEDEFADTTKRDKGSAFHALMDCYYTGSPVPEMKFISDPQVLRWAAMARTWSETHLEPRVAPGHKVDSEVYVASNFAKNDVHHDPEVHDRKYPDLNGYMPGTTDVVCRLATGELLVADWKTGGGTGADKQLLSLAWGLRRVYDGGLPVRLAILYVRDEGVHVVEWEVTDEELDAHGQAMAIQMSMVGKSKEAVVGSHCHGLYCGHLAYCPGITGIIDTAAEGPEALVPAASLARKFTMEKPTSDAHAGYVITRVVAAKRQLAYFEQMVRRYCEDGGRAVDGELEYSKRADGFRFRPRK